MDIDESIGRSRRRMRRLTAAIDISTDQLRAAELWMQLEQAQLDSLLTRRALDNSRPRSWFWITPPMPA